jgi:hypothetical protein
VGTRIGLVVAALLLLVAMPESSPTPELPARRYQPRCALESVSFAINGEPAPLTSVRRGDHVEASFEVPNGCANRVTFASFVAPAPAYDGSRLALQSEYSRSTGVFGPGRHSLAVDIVAASLDGDAPCEPASEEARAKLRASVREAAARVPELREHLRRERHAKAGADAASKSRAEACDATDVALTALRRSGEPIANHRCPTKSSIVATGRTSHGCNNFQVDLSYRPRAAEPESMHGHPPGLIAAVFCIGDTSACAYTDNTGSNAVLGGRDRTTG